MRYIGLVAAAVALAMGLTTAWMWRYNTDSEEPSVRVVNVLPYEVYQDAHITGSIHLAMDDLSQKMQEWDPYTPVVFYCSNYLCQASKDAARMFKDHGFYHVYAYEGGMAEWYQLHQENPDEYPVSGPAQLVAQYTLDQSDVPSTQEDDIAISAQELQKLLKNDILPNKS